MIKAPKFPQENTSTGYQAISKI